MKSKTYLNKFIYMQTTQVMLKPKRIINDIKNVKIRLMNGKKKKINIRFF